MERVSSAGNLSVFNAPGRWFRGNLHTHSTNSDGLLSPEEVLRFYKDRGYDFLAISDHRVTTEIANQDSSGLFGYSGHRIGLLRSGAASGLSRGGSGSLTVQSR